MCSSKSAKLTAIDLLNVAAVAACLLGANIFLWLYQLCFINCICLSLSTVLVSHYKLYLSQLINCICLSLWTVFLTSSNSAQLTAIDLLIVEALLLACCVLLWLAVWLASFSELKMQECFGQHIICFSHSSSSSFVWWSVMTMFKLWFTAYDYHTLASFESLLRDMLDWAVRQIAGILRRSWWQKSGGVAWVWLSDARY